MLPNFPVKNLHLTFSRPEKNYKAVLSALRLDALEDTTEMEKLLSPTELDYTKEAVSPKRRKEFIAGRMVAKIALQQLFPHFEYHNWQLHRGVFTQPVVEGPGALGISITHTDQVVIAIAYPLVHPVGIDLESIPAETAASVIFEHCSKNEKELALQTMGNESLAALKLWTCKESLSKMLHTGLMTPFELFELKEFDAASLNYVSKFVHFPQYQSHSWFGECHFLSMSFPANSTLQTDTATWMDWKVSFL